MRGGVQENDTFWIFVNIINRAWELYALKNNEICAYITYTLKITKLSKYAQWRIYYV